MAFSYGYAPAPTQAPSTSYLFIDGDNLRQTLAKISERVFGGAPITIAWDLLLADHRKAFFYDAIPVQQHGEDEAAYAARTAPKRAELAAIERQPSFHVRSGDAIHRKRRGNEQKMVDVQLAVDALLMASRGLFDRVTLITSDLDFKPLVSALVELGVDVHLLYSRGETNDDLLAAADRADPITLPMAMQWFDSAFRQRHRMPVDMIGYPNQNSDRLPVAHTWQDRAFGVCRIVQAQDAFQLITERERTDVNQRLLISHPSPAFIRMYAEEKYDLIVPDWGGGA